MITSYEVKVFVVSVSCIFFGCICESQRKLSDFCVPFKSFSKESFLGKSASLSDIVVNENFVCKHLAMHFINKEAQNDEETTM